MTIWIALYFSIALLDMGTDAAICAVARRRYNVVVSGVCAILWPVALPAVIVIALYLNSTLED